MNSSWHIFWSAVFTVVLWWASGTLNLETIPPVLIALTPIVSLAGVFFPDLDQRTHLLKHRSFLTHSAFVGILLLIPIFHPHSASILINIFTFNVGLHLIFDLNRPKKMVGAATVKMPNGKKTSAKTVKHLPKSKVSILWLLSHGIILICLSIALL